MVRLKEVDDGLQSARELRFMALLPAPGTVKREVCAISAGWRRRASMEQ
jgi:hypothetical protein